MNFRALMRWPEGHENIRRGYTWIMAALAQGAVIVPDPANFLPPELKQHEPIIEGTEPDTKEQEADAPTGRKNRRRRRLHEPGAGVHDASEGRTKDDANG